MPHAYVDGESGASSMASAESAVSPAGDRVGEAAAHPVREVAADERARRAA